MAAPTPPLLSICIPTFNRAKYVTALVTNILETNRSLQICVHVDGSTDDTFDRLLAINDERLVISVSGNRGKAPAIRSALENVTGEFVMFYDDDDTIFLDSLEKIIDTLGNDVPNDVAGYILQKADKDRQIMGDIFPKHRTNYFELRITNNVKGDKKEITRTILVKRNMYPKYTGERLIPNSIIWYRIAKSFDIFCLNECIGETRYLPDGFTNNIIPVKLNNPIPLAHAKLIVASGYVLGKYKNPIVAIKMATQAVIYVLYAAAFNYPYRLLKLLLRKPT